MKISSNFDSGNIRVVSVDDKRNIIRLTIEKDTQSDFFQWFHFRLTGAAGKKCKLMILNAGESTYPDGWENYKACASYDREEWFRVPTTFRNGVLTIDFKPQHQSVFFAYFAPYSYERHLDLIHEAQLSNDVKMEVIGKTVQGRDIEMLTVGRPGRSKKSIWVIARQHPGESMTEWFVEGFLQRLLDGHDPVSRMLLKDAVFYVVPNMNIDGSIAGNLRANAAGANLNREWHRPSKKNSPEVFYVRNKMDETGVDLFLDIHGDEAIPYNFVVTSEGIPGYDEYYEIMERHFIDHWMETCPDFQDEHKYPVDLFDESTLKMGSTGVAHRFGCLAFTIEMPFKDNDDLPDRRYGWSAGRSKLLGSSVLNPILYVLDDLR
jgi:murein tripeptide amidase MpaA